MCAAPISMGTGTSSWPTALRRRPSGYIRTENTSNRLVCLRELNSQWQHETPEGDRSHPFLSISNNVISNTTPLTSLPSLISLSLNQNPIEDINPLADLPHLEYLYLEGAYLRDVSPLGKLTRLISLNLSVNQIDDVTAFGNRDQWQQLNLLMMDNNQIHDIAPLSALQSVSALYLRNNQITHIEPLTRLENLEDLRLSGNPIEDCPPDIWQTDDIRQIRSWFQSQARDNRSQSPIKKRSMKADQSPKPRASHEVKLILVGNSGAGKTQLSRYLATKKYKGKRQTTHGVRLVSWSPKGSLFENLKNNVKVNIWDFGGQEYYHGIYRLFLSNYAVYILLWETATNRNEVLTTPVTDQTSSLLQHYDYRYWLENIHYYAPHSKILIVQNKIDLEAGKERVIPEIFREYGITEDHYISLKQAANGNLRQRRSFEVFCTDLADCLAAAADDTKPEAWREIRDALGALRDGVRSEENPFTHAIADQHWIHIKDFEDVCLKMDPEMTSDDLYSGY